MVTIFKKADMKIGKSITIIVLLFFCISFISVVNIKAEDRYNSKKLKIQLTEENLKSIENLIRRLEWLYDHGLHRTAKAKELEAALKKLLEELQHEYATKCQGAKAQSDYCKKLADLIKRIQDVLGENANYTVPPKAPHPSKPPSIPPGGVWIDPKPSKAGKGGAETKKKVLKSRPSDDTLSWPVEIPEEAK